MGILDYGHTTFDCKSTLKYGKSTLKCKGAKIYNELPNDIMYCVNHSTFSKIEQRSIINHFINYTCLVYLV